MRPCTCTKKKRREHSDTECQLFDDHFQICYSIQTNVWELLAFQVRDFPQTYSTCNTGRWILCFLLLLLVPGTIAIPIHVTRSQTTIVKPGSVCSSWDELGIQKNVQYIQKSHFIYVLLGLILGVCGLPNTHWGKQLHVCQVTFDLDSSCQEYCNLIGWFSTYNNRTSLLRIQPVLKQQTGYVTKQPHANPQTS